MDKIVIGSIALTYNILAHILASVLFKNDYYDDKIKNSNVILFLVGLSGLVLSRIILKENQDITQSVTSMGLFIGGLLLIFTVFILNWNNITENFKLFIVLTFFIFLIWYSSKYFDNKIIIKN